MSTPSPLTARYTKSYTSSPSTPRHDSGTDERSLRSEVFGSHEVPEDERADGEVILDENGVSESRMQFYDIFNDGTRTRVNLTCHGLKAAPSDPDGTLYAPASTTSGATITLGKEILNRMRYGRVPLMSKTLHADRAFNTEVAENAEAVRKLLVRPTFTLDKHSEKSAFIYAFRDKDLNLVKIGFAFEVDKRRKQLVQSCKITDGLTFVACSDRVVAYRRLEKLIQQDLAPHRWMFECDCRSTSSKGYTKHQEYFDITDEVAKCTIEFWADFVKQDPWDRLPDKALRLGVNTATGLRSDLLSSLMSTDLWRPSQFEEHGHHDKRIQRWRSILNVKGVNTPEPQRSILDAKSEISNEDVKPGLFNWGTKQESSNKSIKKESSSEGTKLSPVGGSTARPSFTFEASSTVFVPPKAASNEDTVAAQPAAKNLTGAGFLATPVSSPFTTTKKSHVEPSPHPEANLDTKPTSKPEPLHESGKQDSECTPTEALRDLTKITTPQKKLEMKMERSVVHSDHKDVDNIEHGLINQSIFLFLTNVLAMEARSLPARTISTDLFQLRWPLACLVVFVLYSPHAPPALSLVMWSVFLPSFLAELRGWELAEIVRRCRSSKLT